MKSLEKMTGRKVVVRANQAGVFFGTLKEVDNNNVILTNARKLYYWSGANTVEQIAESGVKNPEQCNFTCFVDEVLITDIAQMIPCSDEASEIIEEVKVWES